MTGLNSGSMDDLLAPSPTNSASGSLVKMTFSTFLNSAGVLGESTWMVELSWALRRISCATSVGSLMFAVVNAGMSRSLLYVRSSSRIPNILRASSRFAASFDSPASLAKLPGFRVRGALDGLPHLATASANSRMESSSSPAISSAGTPVSLATFARAVSSSALALRSSTCFFQAAASSWAFWSSVLRFSWSSS